jgi:hypothetical protein
MDRLKPREGQTILQVPGIKHAAEYSKCFSSGFTHLTDVFSGFHSKKPLAKS